MIYLSAGHNPTSPGACYKGFCEHEAASTWVDKIQRTMGDRHALIIPTGTVREKAEFVNARQPTALIEIHFNSTPLDSERVEGYMTLHQDTDASRELATEVHSALSDMGSQDRGLWIGYHRLDESLGMNFLLAKSTVPSIIIEPEFIYNQAVILERGYITCRAIARSLMKYKENL